MGAILPLLLCLILSNSETLSKPGTVETPTIDMYQLDAIGLIGNILSNNDL